MMDPNPDADPDDDPMKRTREKLRERLLAGELEDRVVEMETRENPAIPMMQVFSTSGFEEMELNIQDMIGRMLPQQTKQRKAKVAEARKILLNEEIEKLMIQKCIKVANLAAQYDVLTERIAMLNKEQDKYGDELVKQAKEKEESK